MNATRIAMLGATLAFVGVAVVGCASDRGDDRSMRMRDPVAPVVLAPVVAEPAPVMVYAPAPTPIAPAYVAPVVVQAPAMTQNSTSPYGVGEPMLTERAPRADRN